jgi:hypothetical protein
MKRRKTVSVTPAIGASTVAGAIRTFPIVRAAGNARADAVPANVGAGSVGTGDSLVRSTPGLSQNFFTALILLSFPDTAISTDRS